MTASAETAIRAWINNRRGLTGDGRPLPRGAYLAGHQPRSPAHGAYALIYRMPGVRRDVVAEDSNPSIARLNCMVYAGTVEAAETAVVALAEAFNDLNGRPEPCGATGVWVLVTDNLSDPGYVPMPGAGGEQHCFQVSADFMLRA